jgi:hypothetical protein
MGCCKNGPLTLSPLSLSFFLVVCSDYRLYVQRTPYWVHIFGSSCWEIMRGTKALTNRVGGVGATPRGETPWISLKLRVKEDGMMRIMIWYR